MGANTTPSRRYLALFARAALGNPWAPLLLVIVLAVDASSLPRDESVVGRLLNDDGRWTSVSYPRFLALGYESDAGLRIFPSERAAAAAGFDTAAFDFAVELWPTRRTRRGFWAPTMLTIRRDLNRIRGGVPPEAAAFFAATYGPEITTEFQAALAGRHIERHIIWPGVAHNAFAIAIAGLLVASCWLNAPRLKPLLLSERRRKRGLCPHCGYDLAGLLRCPECGRPGPAAFG